MDQRALSDFVYELLGDECPRTNRFMEEVHRGYSDSTATALVEAGWTAVRDGKTAALSKPDGSRGLVRRGTSQGRRYIEVCMDTKVGRRAFWVSDIHFNRALATAKSKGELWTTNCRSAKPHAPEGWE
jgi:hypothetical protein